MHILLVPSWYKIDKNPVSGSFFEEQARALMRAGHRVAIFYFRFRPFSDRTSINTNAAYDDRGLFTICREIRARVPRSRRLNYWYLCTKAYDEFLNYVKMNGRPAVIHAHSVFYGGIIAAYISKKTGIPYVITEHLTDFITVQLPAFDRIISQNIFKQAKKSIVVSSVFKKKLSASLGLPEDTFVIVHNMVNPLFFELNDKKREKGDFVFFTNSFLSPRKNVELIIKSFKIVNEEHPASVLVIGGKAVREADSDYEIELVRLSKELGLSGKVRFLGPLSRQQVKSNLDMADVFLLASKFETFGVVLTEALAAGIPVISTDSGGPVDIIGRSNGVIVQSFSAQDFAEAMLYMIRNYDNYKRNEISNACKNNFGEKIIVQELEKIYSQVC